MIAVKTPAAPPKLLTAWALEKPLAAKAFAKGIPKKFTFSAYASEGVKDALEQAFHSKCAYCESRYKGVTHGDIEHYRPKTYIEVGGKKRAVGYYWLAGEIRNLLPSCRNCNTSSWQEIAGKAAKEKVGKGNWFPLADETKRASSEGAEAGEYRLLLNPYEDDPSEYLEFTGTGLVAPVPSLKGRKKKRAQETIRLYGLSRMHLVRLREDHASRVVGQVDHLRHAYSEWKAAPRNTVWKQRVVTEWIELQKLLADDQPYLAMSQRIVNQNIRLTMQTELTRLAVAAGRHISVGRPTTAGTRKTRSKPKQRGRRRTSTGRTKAKRR